MPARSWRCGTRRPFSLAARRPPSRAGAPHWCATTTGTPALDGVVMRTAYGGRRVLGMGDCLWGLLDGVDDAGIAVSLTFGGRPNVGTGFGIPIVLRYVLQTSDTIDAAVDASTRIPVHMSYNVTVWTARGAIRRVRHPGPARPGHRPGRHHQPPGQGRVEAVRRRDPQRRAV